MPRDSSGSMTLAKAAFTSGTTIVSADVNSDLSDIATELTDSLSRSGKGGLLAPLRFLDGTLAAPAIAFTSETGSGFYRVASNVLAWVIAGAERLRVFATGAKVTGTFEATGAVTADAGLVVSGSYLQVGGVAPSTAGDIAAARAGGTTGLISLGPINRYLYYDGSLYQMPNAALVNPATFVVAASYDASGAVLTQKGSLTLGNATHSSGGVYVISVTGLTTGAIVVSGATGGSSSVLVIPTANTLTVNTFPAGVLGDDTFAFIIAAL